MLKFLENTSKTTIAAYILFLLLLLFSTGRFIESCYKYFSGSYIIKDSDIYKLATFQMYEKAYYEHGGKSGNRHYEFKSRNGYSFEIGYQIYQAIIYKRELSDTLMYHELKFIPYTDKLTFEKFKKERKPIFINVLQFQVGDKLYIDIGKANDFKKSNLIREILLYTFFAVLLLFVYNKKITRITGCR